MMHNPSPTESPTESTVVQNPGLNLYDESIPEPPWALLLIIVGLAWQRYREKRLRHRDYR